MLQNVSLEFCGEGSFWFGLRMKRKREFGLRHTEVYQLCSFGFEKRGIMDGFNARFTAERERERERAGEVKAQRRAAS